MSWRDLAKRLENRRSLAPVATYEFGVATTANGTYDRGTSLPPHLEPNMDWLMAEVDEMIATTPPRSEPKALVKLPRASIQSRLGSPNQTTTPMETAEIPLTRAIHQRLGTTRIDVHSGPRARSSTVSEDVGDFIPLDSQSEPSFRPMDERAREVRPAQRRQRSFRTAKPGRKMLEAVKFQGEVQVYDVDKLEARARRFSDVNLLRKRAWKFSEEVASELTTVRVAKERNLRYDRFRSDDNDDVVSSEEC